MSTQRISIQMISIDVDAGDLNIDVVVSAAATGATWAAVDTALAFAAPWIQQAIADGRRPVRAVLTRRYPPRRRACTDAQLATFLAPARLAVEEIGRAVRRPCDIHFTLAQALADDYGVRIQITGSKS